MIQPEPEGSTQGYPLISVEVLRYDIKGVKVRIGKSADCDGASTGINPTRLNTSAGNSIKEILLKLNLLDHRILKDGGEGDDDEDDGASCASTSSPTTYLNSLGPLDYQQYDVPTSSEQNDDLLFER
ncbi:hypothetical protein Tco_0692234 [Tanacetum coccineum]